MTADRIVRLALWIAIAVNLLGLIVFGTVALGRPALDLPLPIAPFYAAQLALVIGLFGAIYGWLARQQAINRPLLLVGALGKLGFYLLFVGYWLVGDLSSGSVAQATPDLILGGIFLWWLAQPRAAS